MKRILLLGLLVIGGTLTVVGLSVVWLTWGPRVVWQLEPVVTEAQRHYHSESNELQPLRPPVDVDALAARMPSHQDTYKKVRDEALAAYSKRHPGKNANDDLAKMTLKLGVYLCVWNDFYGEGQWRLLHNYAENLVRGPGHDSDPIWATLRDIPFYNDHYNETAEGVRALNHDSDLLAQTEYPALFKLEAYRVAIKSLLEARKDTDLKTPLDESSLPALANGATTAYTQLIADQIPDDLLYDRASVLLDACQADEPTLKAISTGIDHGFAAKNPQDSMADLLDVLFYVDDAWNARGNGWATTVTTQGWQLFRERLASANQMGTDLYAKHPENPRIAEAMMVVVLGQEQPRDQMELWFQRGIKADPNDFHLYMQKRWYLLPRWYGSDEEVWNFGVECSSSENWAAKIPMMLAESTTDAASRDSSMFARPEIWTPLEKVYRAYLARYPDSVHYRSLFAKSAVQGGHWDVAQEQFKMLGDNWDRDVFEDNQYAEMNGQVAIHIK